MSSESTGKFKRGDRVLFRLGERGDWICPVCDHHVFNTEFEEWLMEWSGNVFTVTDTLEEYKDYCPACEHVGELTRFDYALAGEMRVYLGRLYHNFEVFERELTLVGDTDGLGKVVA